MKRTFKNCNNKNFQCGEEVKCPCSNWQRQPNDKEKYLSINPYRDLTCSKALTCEKTYECFLCSNRDRDGVKGSIYESKNIPNDNGPMFPMEELKATFEGRRLKGFNK